MPVAAGLRPLATAAELLAIPEEGRFHEIINGELVRKAMPSGRADLGVPLAALRA